MGFGILHPYYRDISGTEHLLTCTKENVFSDGTVTAVFETERIDDSTVRLRHTWQSLEGPVKIQPVIQIEDGFVCDRYTVPCVSFNGNIQCSGGEPKGIEHEGIPWVFDARRTGIPGCTLTENVNEFCALFAEPDSVSSLTVSCSLEKSSDGRMIHKLLYPFIEEPLTYCCRDRYSPSYQTFVELDGNHTFCASALIVYGKPSCRNFALIEVQNVMQRYLTDIPKPAMSTEEMWRLGISYAKKLESIHEGAAVFRIGYYLRPEAAYCRRNFEFGWCGQNGLYSRMMIEDFKKRGEKSNLDFAVKCLDAWSQAVHPVTGLPWVYYESRLNKDAISDMCNISYYISEMLASYISLKEIGIDRPSYFEAAKKTADFLAEHISDEYGLGKAWRVSSGECVDTGGTIGAFPIHSLAELYDYTGEKKYLDAAEKLMNFYFARDLANFECTAGALDSACVDKESSCGLIMGGICLFESTGKKEYLDYARLAAEYFCSWMYYYDTPCNSDSDFAKYGYRSLGGTAVSVVHHCIDPWGVLMVPFLRKLARYSSDGKWNVRADLLWFGGTQLITPAGGATVRGLERPEGSVGEPYCPSRWSTVEVYYPEIEKNPNWVSEAGSFNDWLVSWPGAFRLFAISEAEKRNR